MRWLKLARLTAAVVVTAREEARACAEAERLGVDYHTQPGRWHAITDRSTRAAHAARNALVAFWGER